MELELVAAIGPKGEMGVNNDLPWRLPSDLKHFKKITKDSVLIMGRKTFDSLPGLLPGREHIVLSKSNKPKKEGAHYVSSIQTLQDLVEQSFPDKRLIVIGGAQIYLALSKYVKKAYISHVDCQCDADIFFPMDILKTFSQKNPYPHSPDQNDQHSYKIMLYQL